MSFLKRFVNVWFETDAERKAREHAETVDRQFDGLVRELAKGKLAPGSYEERLARAVKAAREGR